MKIKNLTFILVIMIIFAACNSSETTQTQAEETQQKKEATTFTNADFSIELGEEKEVEMMPQIPVFIKTDLAEAPILLTTESAFTEVTPDTRANEGIPEDAAFSFYTYYAGAGYYYYGNVENAELKVYRKYSGEDLVEEKYTFFKSFKF